METREQRKRRHKRKAICWAIVFVLVAALLCTYANAAFEPEQIKADLSVVGAFTVASALTRVIVWLDTPRKEKKIAPRCNDSTTGAERARGICGFQKDMF